MEPALIGSFRCSQPECSIETTGKCVNGLNPEDCTNKISIIKDQAIEEERSIELVAPKTKKLWWGNSFEEDDIYMITYRYPCKLILLIGEPSSGKSTLYAALFDSFHKGGCGKYLFTSTRTPIGFESICHLAREKSKGKIPKTERSKSYEFTYLHISARHKSLDDAPQHLIFADVNGERFQAAKDSDDEVQKLQVMKRADQIFFIADGGLLLNNSEKHAVKDDVWRMIKRSMQNEMINENTPVSLIVTKWDEINAAGKIDDINKFFIEPTLNNFVNVINNVIKVASRSMNDEVPPRTGLDEFLEICMSNVNALINRSYTPKTTRQFQKFKYNVEI